MYHIILNRASGGGVGELFWEKKLLPVVKQKQISYRLYPYERAGHGGNAAKEILAACEGDLQIIVIGGDGTFNEVINGLGEEGLQRSRLGFVALGIDNDLPYGLHMPQDPVEAFTGILEDEAPRTIDIGRLTYYLENAEEKPITHLFAISSGIGMDAKTCRQTFESPIKKLLNKFGRGGLIYRVIGAKLLLFHPLTNADVILTTEAGEERMRLERTYFMVAMNCSYEGGHVNMAPRASVQDGAFSFAFLHKMSRLRTIYQCAMVFGGKAEKVKDFYHKNAVRVELFLENAMEVHTDGEVFGEHKHICLECLKGRMRVLGTEAV